MKTLQTTIGLTAKVLLVLAFVFGSINLVAGNSPSPAAALSSKLQKSIQFNKRFSIQKSEKVEVVFTTGTNGKADVVIVKTANAGLKKEIEEAFAALDLSGFKANDAYSVVLNFKFM